MIRGADFEIPQNRSEENANKNILRLDLLVRIAKMKTRKEQQIIVFRFNINNMNFLNLTHYS